MNKTAMTGTEICQNYITPAVEKWGVGSADPDPQQLARAIWINEFNYGIADLELMGFPLDVTVQIAYDIVRAQLGDQRYGINYTGSCWNISAQYRDTKIGAFPTREFLIVIGLKGDGALPEIKGSLGGY
jgi:hypothetical protein